MTAIQISKIPILGARYAQLLQLCEHYRVEKLYVFGSVITERFNPLTSDIDLIVELQPMSPTEGGNALINLGIDLEVLFERKVDLLSDQPIKNIIFKRVVERTKQLIYDRKAQKYLYDMLNAIELIELFSQGIDTFNAYRTDLKTKSAIERQIAIIGEAVTHFKKQETEVLLSNMPQIIAVRNRLIHAYDKVDDIVIWAIVDEHLAHLKLEVQTALDL